MRPVFCVALGLARLAIRRAVNDAIADICGEEPFSSSPRIEKTLRVEKHALRELAFFLIEGAA